MFRNIFKAYIYPITARGGGMTNPYIYNFIKSLEDPIDFLNRSKPSESGIFDFLRYINKINLLFLNWPEEIPDKKAGLIQTFLLWICIHYLKIRNVKIIYTLHNKKSHTNDKSLFKKALKKFIIRKADLILTHAKEGIEIAKKISKDPDVNVAFFYHPVLSKIYIQPDLEKKYDILIWGTIEPYKGIDKFISFINEQKLFEIKILIAGKIKDESYKQKILHIKHDNIDIIDKFISDNELSQFISISKAILFTYTESSILSSGVLMDSLRFAPLIIGPDFGSFKDLSQEGLIYTYSDYNELFKLLTKINGLKVNISLIEKFIKDNSWANFGKSLSKLLH